MLIVKHKYGDFPSHQINDYKKQLHNKIHWLLIYKDPKLENQYSSINVEQYIEDLQLYLAGLNELFLTSPVLISILASLESMKILLQQPDFDFYSFRKLVLGTHRLVDDI